LTSSTSIHIPRPFSHPIGRRAVSKENLENSVKRAGREPPNLKSLNNEANATKGDIKMTRTSKNEFIRKDGSVDTTKAMMAGHDERTEALRVMGRAAAHWISRRLSTFAKRMAPRPA
jgi:hypothetical protein